MSNFNKVFCSIKQHCLEQKKLCEINCFEQIAKDAELPITKLPIYLQHLQEIGVIEYSLSDKFIHLTTIGKQKEKII